MNVNILLLPTQTSLARFRSTSAVSTCDSLHQDILPYQPISKLPNRLELPGIAIQTCRFVPEYTMLRRFTINLRFMFRFVVKRIPKLPKYISASHPWVHSCFQIPAFVASAIEATPSQRAL
jgi:hypothetical protein